jgi:DNA-binding CsgD family transcriptional regulator
MPARRRIPELDDLDWLTTRREQGWTITRIAESVGADPGRVRKALRDAGLPPRLRRDVPELADVDWLTERRREGWTVQQIANHLHVDNKRVPHALRDAGLPAALPPRAHSHSPPTYPELYDLEWMRRELRTRTMADIARQLGCSERSVRDAAARAGRIPGPPRPRRPDLLDDVEWLRTQLVTRSAEDLARQLGCSPSTVRNAANRHGVTYPTQGNKPRFPELHDPEWLAANIYTGTAAEIAERLGCSLDSVKTARRRYQALQDQSG